MLSKGTGYHLVRPFAVLAAILQMYHCWIYFNWLFIHILGVQDLFFKENWTDEEELKLIHFLSKKGRNRWDLCSEQLERRHTADECQKHYEEFYQNNPNFPSGRMYLCYVVCVEILNLKPRENVIGSGERVGNI